MRRFSVVAAAVAGAIGLPLGGTAVAGQPRAQPAERYLNLHQCVYVGSGGHYTNVLPNTANTAFNTGTCLQHTRHRALLRSGRRGLEAGARQLCGEGLRSHRRPVPERAPVRVLLCRAALHSRAPERPERQLQHRHQHLQHGRYDAELCSGRGWLAAAPGQLRRRVVRPGRQPAPQPAPVCGLRAGSTTWASYPTAPTPTSIPVRTRRSQPTPR